MIVTAAAIASTAKLLAPLINDLYAGAKKAGVAGLKRWDERTYPAKLARRIRSLEEVKTLWKPEGGISLLDFYHPPRVRIDGKPILVSRLLDIGVGNIVIEGIVGQGKSILLRSLAINEILSNSAARLPIFFELRTLSAKLSFTDAVYRQFEALDIDIDEGSLDYIYRSKKVALLLDGFDELEEGLVKDTLREIEFLIQKYPELQVVITSRPGNEVQKSASFHTLRISPLTAAEYPAFLQRLKLDASKSLAIRTAIKNNPSDVSSLITTPLMLTLVVLVYETDSEIPETLPEFFERLFQVVFSRHDRMKATFNRKHYSGLSERYLKEFFQAFCFMTLQLGYNRTLTSSQFLEAFDLAQEYSEDCDCEVDNFRKDITRVSCLMLEEGFDDVTFLHKSILDFYAASYVKALSEENAEIFYKSVADDPRNWLDVVYFLKSIDSFRYQRDYVLRVINSHRKDVISPLENLSDRDFIDKFCEIFPGVGVQYQTRTEGAEVLFPAQFGPVARRPGDAIGSISHLILDTISLHAPSELSLIDFQANFGPLDVSGNSKLISSFVPLKKIMAISGCQSLRQAVGILSIRLQEAEDLARKVVNAQEKKKLIFSLKR